MIAMTTSPSIAQSRQPTWLPTRPLIESLYIPCPMPTFPLPAGEIPAELSQRVGPQIVSPAPLHGSGWLHEIETTGAVCWGTSYAMTCSPSGGHDRTSPFREAVERLAELPPLVLHGEIAERDECGVTHNDALSEALAQSIHFAYARSTSSTLTATICGAARSRKEDATTRRGRSGGPSVPRRAPCAAAVSAASIGPFGGVAGRMTSDKSTAVPYLDGR